MRLLIGVVLLLGLCVSVRADYRSDYGLPESLTFTFPSDGSWYFTGPVTAAWDSYDCGYWYGVGGLGPDQLGFATVGVSASGSDLGVSFAYSLDGDTFVKSWDGVASVVGGELVWGEGVVLPAGVSFGSHVPEPGVLTALSPFLLWTQRRQR